MDMCARQVFDFIACFPFMQKGIIWSLSYGVTHAGVFIDQKRCAQNADARVRKHSSAASENILIGVGN